MEQLITRAHGMSVRAIREAVREVDFVASTDAVDSHDEVVEQSWVLDRYLSNPVVLFAHQSRELPIGKCTRVGVIDGQLECTIKFATADQNPKADQVFKLVKDEMLRAVSVGFRPRTVRRELRDGQEVFVLADNELHEISVVPIPSNPEALAKAKAAARAEAVNPEHKEPSMELEQLKAALETERTARTAAETKTTALEADAAKAVAERDAFKAAAETAEGERDAARAEATKLADEAATLRDQLTERDVDALVGVKITPAEKDAMAALAKKDRASFDALVEARPTLDLLKQVVPSVKTDKTETAPTNAAQELAARAMRSPQ